jgi:2-polyprenyl-3-methyl-5-hydroxy-6-metoxy-1,4-benzoquinol methylase
MKKTNAVSFHDSISKTFSDKYNKSPDFIERKHIWQQLLQKYVKPDIKVLDAGCGNGIFSIMAARLGAQVIGIDGSQAMIDLCNEEKEVFAKDIVIEFKCAMLPANSILNKTNYFDLIILGSVLEYIKPLDEVMETLKNVSKKDGFLIISFPNRDSLYRKMEKILFSLIKMPYYYTFVHNTWTLTQFEIYCKKFGFNVVESEFYGGQNFINKLTAKMGDKISKNLCVVVLKNNN